MEDRIRKDIEREKDMNISYMIKNTLIIFIGVVFLIYLVSNILKTVSYLNLEAIISAILLIIIYVVFHIITKKVSKSKNSLELIFIFLSIIPIYFYIGGVKSPLVLIYFIILFEYIVVNSERIHIILFNTAIVIINILYIIIMHDFSSTAIMMEFATVTISILISYEAKSTINFTSSITQKYEFEKENREKIDKINKDKDEFISTTSHELRTPIAAVRGYLQLITLDPSYKTLNEEIISEIDKLIIITDDLTKLIENLLNVSRLDLNRIFINNVEFNLNDEILKTVERIIKKASKKNINIIFKPRTFDIKITTDPDKLSDSIFNLLDNSVKFSKDGESIYIHANSKENKIYIKIKDHAGGIPARKMGHIFEKFENSSDKSKKTVLGLYLSKRFINILGGKIFIKSKENIGTTAIIEI